MKKLIILVVVVVGAYFAYMALSPSNDNMSAGGKVEVLHWWTSGGEAAALDVLRQDLKSKGIEWEDAAVAGGGGSQAMTTLKARAASGNPPTAAQLLGFDITSLAEIGILADLNDLAEKENWSEVIPKGLQKFAIYDGKWVSAPVNIHSVNWVWGNKKILDEVGVSSPNNWNDFIKAAKKIKAAGYIAFAHGGQDWQDATVFDSIIYSTGGKDFYESALIDLDQNSLKSATMVKAFDRFREFKSYVDANFSGREWSQTTALLLEDKAAFQVMGDWAKGEFIKAKKIPDEDFVCFRFPGTQDAVLFNSDQFAMFKVDDDKRAAQITMAKSILSPKFQIAFNKVKGSVPARVDISDEEFDACAKKGMAQVAAANKNGTFIGSMAHGHAAIPAVKAAYYDVVTTFFNDDGMSAKDAANSLADSIAAAQ